MNVLKSLDRALGFIVIASNCVGSLVIFAMTIGVVADVTGRYLFNSPIYGTAEMVTMGVVAALYLQLSYTLRSGRMTRSDSFLVRLTARWPRLGAGLNGIFHLAGAAFIAVVAVSAWPKLETALNENFYVGVIGVFSFPEWPLLAIIWFGAFLTVLQFLVLAAGHLGGLFGGTLPARGDGVEHGSI